MHELMEDYLEVWTVLRGRLRKITRKREFLFANKKDYKNWLNSITHHGIADALENRHKWDQRKPFQQFAFLRARTLVRTELECESRFFNAKRVLAREQSVEYIADAGLTRLFERHGIEQALEQLSQDQAEAIALRYEADLPVNEIARLMERKPNAISALLNRARQRLEELLGEEPPLAKELTRDTPPSKRQARARSHLEGEDAHGPPTSYPNNVIPLRNLGGQREKDQQNDGTGPGSGGVRNQQSEGH